MKELTDYERDQVADVLEVKEYQKGIAIINEDEIGDHFYILEHGTCQAKKQLESD